MWQRLIGTVIAGFLIMFLVSTSRAFDCDEGHFRCNSSDMCVAQRQNCDKKQDCPDGSDEWNCADKHRSKYYDHVYRKRPGAENDQDCTTCLLNYTGKCRCEGRNIECLHAGLTQLPFDLPPSNITLLDFTGNTFYNFNRPHETTRRRLSVETLVLRHCTIHHIYSGVFQNISNLRTIFLDHNMLQTLPIGLFSPGNQIQVLVLASNFISYLPDNVFIDLTNLQELDLRRNLLKRVQMQVLEPLVKLVSLYLNENQIKTIRQDSFPVLPVEVLSLSDNKLDHLDAGVFSNLQSLQSLYLAKNNIRIIQNYTFQNLTGLLALNLERNNIEAMEIGAFEDLRNLNSLFLTGNKFRTLDKRVLQNLHLLDYVYFDDFLLCKAARHVRVCEPNGDGISSQAHLLDNPLLRASVWVMATFAVIGNVLVLLGRLLAREPNAIHSLYIRNLALSDLLMGIYLLLIALADQRYRDCYIDHEEIWRHSTQCNFCGFLSTLSCESSVLILSLVTWDRLVSVTRPLTRLQQSRKTALTHIATLWTIATSVSLIPLTGVATTYFGEEFYGNNGVCLSLHIHDPFAKGWEYSASMFICINAIALVFIIYAYSRMLREIRLSGVALRSTQDRQERAVAMRFSIIVLTDCLCWVPVIFVKLTALSGVHISGDIYAWLAIFVLPINSALNPVLYTLTTSMFKQQIRKMMLSLPCKKPAPDNTQSGFDSALSLSLGAFPLTDNRRHLLVHRSTQSSFTNSRLSWKRTPTPV